jgi:hypothetical protein
LWKCSFVGGFATFYGFTLGICALHWGCPPTPGAQYQSFWPLPAGISNSAQA